LTISVVESSKQRRLVVEGRVVAPWSDELKAACERAGSGLDGRELVIDLKNHNDDRPTGRKPASGTDEAGGQMPRLWRVYECDFETGRPQIAQEWSTRMNCLWESRGAKDHPSEYATVEDFRNVFTEEMNKLHLLALLLTGDEGKAQQCFVAGIEDSVSSNSVFRDWAHSGQNA